MCMRGGATSVKHEAQAQLSKMLQTRQTLTWSKSLREKDEKSRQKRKREKMTVTQGGTRTRDQANGLPYSNQLSYQVTQQLSG